MNSYMPNEETAIFHEWIMEHRAAEIMAKVQQAIKDWKPSDSIWDDDEFESEVFDILEIVADVIAEEPTPYFLDGAIPNFSVNSNDESLAEGVLRPLLKLAARRIEPGCLAVAFLERYKELIDINPPNPGPDRRVIQLD